jgi:hypothetical protein
MSWKAFRFGRSPGQQKCNSLRAVILTADSAQRKTAQTGRFDDQRNDPILPRNYGLGQIILGGFQI